MIAKELDLRKFWMVISNGMGAWDQVLNLSVLQIFPPLHLTSLLLPFYPPNSSLLFPSLNLINTGSKPYGIIEISWSKRSIGWGEHTGL